MTPQLYIKLTQQIARQTPEAEALEAQALALQPGIDSAQTWLDSCQASVDAAQAALTEAQAVEGADTTAQQDAVNAATATLETAKSDLAKVKAPQDTATAHAKQIRAQIEQCQAQIDQSGMTMTQAEMDAIINAPVVPQTISFRQGKTLMELTPHPTFGDLWTAANTLAEAIEDRTQRILTVNYIRDSQLYEYQRVLVMSKSLLGMTEGQVQQMFIAAAKL